MTIRDLQQDLLFNDESHRENYLDMEVEFHTIYEKVELLSIYENEGKIIIDIGTVEDVEERNSLL